MKTCTRCNEAKPLDQFGPNRRAKDGLAYQCRPCCAEERKADYHARIRQRRTRPCAECGVEKHIDEFVKYRPDCKACRAEGKRCTVCNVRKPLDAFATRNATLRRRRRVDPEWRARQRAEARRRYQMCKAGMTLEQVAARDGWDCYLCGQPTKGDAEIEHIIPRVRGGSDDPTNVGIAHRSCNRRKQARSVDELDWVVPAARERARLLGAVA